MKRSMPPNYLFAAALLLLKSTYVEAFRPPSSGPSARGESRWAVSLTRYPNHPGPLFSSNGPDLEEKFGGYTVKQRLREEVESPFRTVRLFFFGSSTGSALTALYFSLLSTVKASAPTGTYVDQMSMNDALTNCAINTGAVVLCGFLTYRDWKAGDKNLERIARGGALAQLLVLPAAEADTSRRKVAEYRRNARLVIVAGGKDYIERVCRSLNADEFSDENRLPQALASADVVIIPVVLEGTDGKVVGDSVSAWRGTLPTDGRNFDSKRSDEVIAFPRGNTAWADYLRNEVETATKQGFDVLDKGLTITVKKNGRILRRATGMPQWGNLIGTMEVMDGSKFGMPGDDAIYGKQ